MTASFRRALPLVTLLALAAAVAATAQAPADSTWRDHDAAADSARARRDWVGWRRHLAKLDTLIGGHPAVVVSLARASARLGDTAAAFAALRRFEAMGLVRDLAADSDLAALHASPSWAKLMQRMEAHGHEIPAGAVAAALPDSVVVAEDVAWDASGRRWLVSDLRRGRILSVGPDGEVRPFFDRHSDTWAVFAVGVDAPRRVAWATTFAMAQMDGSAPADSGRAALLRLDLGTGRVLGRIDFPRTAGGHAPGDMAVAPDGDVFVADGATGELFVVAAGTNSLRTLVRAGELPSPQQPAVAPDGRTVLVADYVRGIAAVDRATGTVTWLRHPATVALNGIDGLVFHGSELIAMQNGTAPNRILRLTLDAGLRNVTAVTVVAQGPAIDEPTHATVVRDGLVVISRSGWSRVKQDGTVRTDEPARPVTLLRLPLR